VTHDRFGHRIDEVRFHPAWHELMRLGRGAALHALPWRDRAAGSHVERAAGFMLLNHAENGVCCPLTMTFATVPALSAAPDLASSLVPRITSLDHEPRLLPFDQKTALSIGMAMTEKQGGSDVRANTTEARAVDQRWWQLRGHKWFCSAPMSDAFLTLAQVDGAGLSCFLIPRILPDGRRNPFALQRLKDKLGNRSNASSEVELDQTLALPVGDPGRGIATIMEMVQHTRLDCALGSAGIMRAALAEALHHAHHRRAFGALLIDQPLMRAVLADLHLEVEGATALALRLAHAFDRARAGDEQEAAFARIATPIAKYWICKRCPVVVAECLECLGGSGYVEESVLPRLYREAPLSSIWEGSGNVMCLDVLRALRRHPDSLRAVFAATRTAAAAHLAVAAAANRLQVELAEEVDAARARWITERLALCLVAAALCELESPVAAAYVDTRLTQSAAAFGAAPLGAGDIAQILRRAWPIDV
jgi:putative acyl-CoA dehydrogenase